MKNDGDLRTPTPLGSGVCQYEIDLNTSTV